MTRREIERMSWKEFIDLEEVQVDESLSGQGNALFYNDGHIQVSVDFEGHDDTSLWDDEALAKELQKLVVQELESGMEELKLWLEKTYGEGGEITINFEGESYTGTMYGNDECFDGDSFFQYVLVGDALYKAFYEIPEGEDD